jgi:transposase/copper chaperone CopZ
METHVLRVVTMHCADCAALIDQTLTALPGVHTAHATLASREVEVTLDPARTSTAAVAAALTDLGFRLRPPARAPRLATPAGSQVSDAAWAVLEPLLRDRVPTRGRTRDPRTLVEGIAYKHRADVRWREVPAEFGPWQTLYAWWARLRTDGTWTELAAVARRHADVADELAWLESATG